VKSGAGEQKPGEERAADAKDEGAAGDETAEKTSTAEPLPAFDATKRRLDIALDFKAGSRFSCPECNASGCPVHDTVEKQWRHLDFFQHQAILTARTPRINCTKCGVRLVTVPWARPNSGFTLLFEGFAMALAIHMPIAVAAGFLKVTDKRLWRVVFHYVGAAVARMGLSRVTRVAIDETAAKRGQDYITIVADIDDRRVVFVTDGRSADTVRQLADHIEAHGGDASRIKQASIDMSPAFIAGVTDNLTEAEITFDRFHVMKLIGDAVDEVRRGEVKARPELKGTRYVWAKNQPNLTAKQADVLAALSTTNLKTARAWRMRLAFQDIYAQPSRPWGDLFFDLQGVSKRNSTQSPVPGICTGTLCLSVFTQAFCRSSATFNRGFEFLDARGFGCGLYFAGLIYCRLSDVNRGSFKGKQ
jgi:transposase